MYFNNKKVYELKKIYPNKIEGEKNECEKQDPKSCFIGRICR